MSPSTNKPISSLYLFPVYSTRAAYLAATGQQAPPFNPALPIKQWSDPAPSGQPYLMFDTKAGVTFELPLPAAFASAVNLPGAATYAAFVETPTDATQNCTFPWVAPTPLDPATLCTQAEAQAEANEVASFFPGKTVTIAQAPYGSFYASFPADELRRQWCILVNGVSPYGAGFNLYAKTLIIDKAARGVDSPGHFIYTPAPGEPAGDNTFQWVADSQVVTPPANAVTLPVPIQPLQADQQFVLVPPANPLFGQAAWMVETIPPAPVITLAQVQQLVAQYDAQPGVTQIAIS